MLPYLAKLGRVGVVVLLLTHTWFQSSYSTAFCVGAVNVVSTRHAQLNSISIEHDIRVPCKIPRHFPPIRTLYERVAFSWVKDLMVQGNAKPLDIEDLWLLQEQNRMYNASQTFDQLLSQEQSQNNCTVGGGKGNLLIGYWRSPVTRAIVKMYRKQLLSTGALKLVNTVVQFTPSLLVARILKFIGQSKRTQASLPPAATVMLARIAENSTPLITTVASQVLSALYNEGFQLSLLLFLSLSIKTAIENQYFDAVSQLSSAVRGTLSTAVYRKALKLSPASRANNTMGEVVNYMQLDTARLEHVVHSIHTVWDGALQILGYTFLLVQFLGPSVFAGIAAMLIILPLNSYFLRRISALREANLKNTDQRVKLTNELLQGIRAIKSYNWEAPFAAQLKGIRDAELAGLKSAASMRSLLVSTLSTAPSIVAVCTLAMYAILGNELSPTKVFTSLALFNQLRFPLIFYPLLLNTLAEGRVSLKRLTGFLQAEEVQNYVKSADEVEVGCSENEVRRRQREAVRVVNGTFTWSSTCRLPASLIAAQEPVGGGGGSDGAGKDGETGASVAAVTTVAGRKEEDDLAGLSAVDIAIAQNRDRLADINLSIRRGQLVAIIGPTGSGKTTLLHALLGELNKCSGEVVVKGKVAYVPQSAWIPNGSLRNVILFGKPYDRAKYQRALRICGLQRDLQLLEAGDQTEIGERGANLSGGQKQRVSVARAVYEDADIFLFDDPLSALDNAVGARLFVDCIKRGLAGKTRLLVTHQLSVLSQVDRVVLMDQGGAGGGCRILDQGTLRELLSRGHDLSKYVTEQKPPEDTPAPSASAGDVQSAAITTVVDGGDQSVLNAAVVNDVVVNTTIVQLSSEFLTSAVPPSGGLVDVSAKPATLVEPAEIAVAAESTTTTSATTETPALAAKSDMSTPPISVSTLSPAPATAAQFSSVDENSAVQNLTKKPAQLISREERVEGAVSTQIYRAYIAAANKPAILALLVLSVVMSNVSLTWQQWVVVAWTSDAQYARRPLAAYLAGVTAMAGLVGVFNYLRSYFGIVFGVASSRTIHSRMIDRVLHAPLAFFESTPVGRLVQRFSKDLDQIDQQLPSSIGQLLSSTFSILNCVVAIAMVTPSFSLVLVALLVAYVRVTNYYRAVARELKRVEAISRSPIYTHFSETLGGLSVIRSFRKQGIYLRTNEVRLDENISAYNTLKVVDRWLCVRLEMLGNVIVLFASLLAVLKGSRAGSAGLSLNNALGVTSLLNWAVRNAAETEALMNSVERVSYTINATPQERPNVVNKIASDAVDAAAIPESVHLPSADTLTPSVGDDSQVQLSDKVLLESGWPYSGQITLRGVHLRYRTDFEEVLKGVDLVIKPGERVGIVGRTGSGKSSLFRALLRLTEVGEGRIDIDGVDVSRIGLDALRSSVSIIPQDPVLFSGTIRFNLDPFETHTDAQLWAALRKANLHRTVLSLPGGLRYVVAEGGDNFSLGQRQLLCLARALVRRSRILLLDEATSSVDFATDAQIQQTIRREFGDGTTTVLTIAHRLDSVLDADRIVVMDAGRVVECDAPAVLLRNPNSVFAQLVAVEDRTHRMGRDEDAPDEEGLREDIFD